MHIFNVQKNALWTFFEHKFIPELKSSLENHNVSPIMLLPPDPFL